MDVLPLCTSPVTDEAEVRFPTELPCALLLVEMLDAFCLVFPLDEDVLLQSKSILLVAMEI